MAALAKNIKKVNTTLVKMTTINFIFQSIYNFKDF